MLVQNGRQSMVHIIVESESAKPSPAMVVTMCFLQTEDSYYSAIGKILNL